MKRTTLNALILALLLSTSARAVDVSNVPQIHENKEHRDARMQWFRDAKFGMFIHWGPCSVGAKEIGWDRNANRPWDIGGIQTPRTIDPVYDNYYKQFNPTKYDAEEWVRFAKESGMKYMVLIDKELFERNGKCEGETLKAAFEELTRIYHAENAHSMPIKPPQIR